jgi:hypothetical protein
MEAVDDSVKQAYPRLKAAEDVEHGLRVLHGLKAKEYDGIGMSPVSKTPVVILSLFQVGLRRTIELAEAAIREINRRNVTTAAILSRATIETTCPLREIVHEIEEVAENGKTERLEKLTTMVNRAVVGGKAERYMLAKEIKAHHVLDMVRNVAKRHDIPLWDVYETLSECAHPNYHGMMATYSEPGAEGGIKIFIDRRESIERAVITDAITVLATSVTAVIHTFERVAQHIEAMAVLAERQVYEAGTWPKDVEYPVRRAT